MKETLTAEDNAFKGYTKRIVLSHNAFKEKLLIFDAGFDDKIVEVMKSGIYANVEAHYKDKGVDEIFFATNEVQEIWLTFSDPQMKNPRKRLSSTFFLNRYRNFLEDRGVVHLKTDSNFLFTYTTYLVKKNKLPLLFRTEDLYANETNGVQSTELDPRTKEILGIHTYYENQWIERGLNIKYMKFQLPHEGELAEPDIEIELDDYRSFKRTKRSGKDTAK